MSKNTCIWASRLLQSSSLTLISQRFKGGHQFNGLAKTPKPENKPRHLWDEKHLKELTGGNYTTAPLVVRKLGGRDPETGRKVNQHIGGGVKFDYFMIDFHRRGPDEPDKSYDERVLEVRRDPNRSAYIALVAGMNGKRWLIATEDMHAGKIIQTFGYIPSIPIVGLEGNAYRLGALNIGTSICCIERYPTLDSAVFIITAGSSGTIMRHTDEKVVVRMPFGKEFAFDKRCFATVGRISHVDVKTQQYGSAQMHRRFGYKMSSGLWHRKTGYFGRKEKILAAPLEIKEKHKIQHPLKKFTLSNEPGGPLSGLTGTDAVHPLISKTNFRF